MWKDIGKYQPFRMEDEGDVERSTRVAKDPLDLQSTVHILY